MWATMCMAWISVTPLAAEIDVGPGQPHASIGSGVQAAGPGDVILVHPGTYDESLELGSGGQPDAPIRIESTREHQALLRGTIDLPGSHWEIVGLAIETPGGTDGIRLDGDHNLLERVDLYGGSRDGVDGSGVGNTIRASRIHDFDAGDDDAHCIVLNPGAEDWVIADNELFDCSGDGVQLYADGAERTIHDTIIEGNEIYWSGAIGRSENAIDIKNADGLIIRNNTMHGFVENKTMVFQKGPIGIEVTCNRMDDGFTGVEFRGEDGGTVEDIVFAYNLMVGYEQYSLKFDRTVGAQVFNNTFVEVQGDGLRIEGDGLEDGQVRNNLWIDVQEVEGGSFTADHNGFFQVGDIQIGSPSDVLDDPMLDASFELQRGSPMIDAGVDAGYGHEGSAPDIGWSEWSGDPCAELGGGGGDDGGSDSDDGGDGGDGGSQGDGGDGPGASTGSGGSDEAGTGSDSGGDGSGPLTTISGAPAADDASTDGCSCRADTRHDARGWALLGLLMLAWRRQSAAKQ